MRTLSIVILTTAQCWAAACVSTAAGSWSSTSTWTACGGGVPGNGDTVTIGHAISVGDSRTVGHSPGAADSVAAILVNGTGGSLTISPNATLIARGDIRLNNAPLTVSAGAVLEFDASAAAAPATARYVLQISTASNQIPAVLNVAGAAGNRARIRSNPGGANARITHAGFFGGGRILADHFEFLRLGDATNDAMTFAPPSGTFVWRLKTGVCDTCGRLLQSGGPLATQSLTVEEVTFRNTAHASESVRLFGASGGTFRFVNNVMDKAVYIVSLSGWTMEGNLMLSSQTVAAGLLTSYRHNLNQNVAAASGLVDFDSSGSDSYFIAVATNSNPHFIKASSTRDVVFDGFIFEHLGTNTNGDCIFPPAPSTPKTLTVRNAIKLPNANGGSTCAFISASGNANATVIVDKNTIHLGGARDSSGIRFNEAYAGHAGMFSSIRSNAFWDTSARGYKVYPLTPPGVLNVVSALNSDYNGGSSAEYLAGASGKGYDNLYSGGTPGEHDVESSPKFADPTRKLSTWDAHLGGPGTAANALAQLAKRNDASGYNPRYNIPDLLNWVRRGFAPRNPRYATGGHDGGRIGAVDPLLPFGYLGNN